MPGTHTNLLYHAIFSTKNRLPLILPEFQTELYAYIGGIIRGEGGILLDIGGISDHVHLLFKYKPADLSDLMRVIKSNSSKWLNQQKYRMRKFGWQEGYGAFSVSESQVKPLRRYIRNQAQHHRKQTFQQEYIAFLDKNGIEYDERYLWD